MSRRNPTTPGSPPLARVREVPIADIDSSAKPRAWLTNSIAKFGLFCPVVLADRGDAPYQVIKGHSRIAAARAAGLKKVPANVFDHEDVKDFLPMLQIMLGRQRRRKADESLVLNEVVRLSQQGAKPAEIARALNVDQRQVRTFLKIHEVHSLFRREFAAGRATYRVIRLIAALPASEQRRLAEILATSNRQHENFHGVGRVTEKWVRQNAKSIHLPAKFQEAK